MTRLEREQLIERFLREELTPSEEHDFFIEAATDKELRLDLKASRVVDRAFRKDRTMAPSSYGSMRNHFASLLAAERTASVEKEENIPPAAAAPRTGSRLGWIATAASIGLVSLAALLIGIVAIDQDGEEERVVDPIRIEENSTLHPNRVPNPYTTDESAREMSAGPISPTENREPASANSEGSSRRSANNRQDGTMNRPDSENEVHPRELVLPPNRSTPENIPTDTTNPDNALKIEIHTPD